MPIGVQQHCASAIQNVVDTVTARHRLWLQRGAGSVKPCRKRLKEPLDATQLAAVRDAVRS